MQLIATLAILGSIAAFASASSPAAADTKPAGKVSQPIPLWPGAVPGEKGDIQPEHDTTKQNAQGKPEDGIIRLGFVSQPTITIYSPPADRNTGAAVIVCPGGGYSILAYDLEGSEICDWLNSIGVTGILLKYRVPVRNGLPRYGPPLQDAQRAIGLVRSRAAEWGVKTDRIGILGFSAGGHLSAVASNNFSERTYPPTDDADKLSCRPDYTILIYPAYLTPDSDHANVVKELPISSKTPPTFMVMTQDDPVHVENVFTYGMALKQANVPFELHVYPDGGHGYGLRKSTHEVSHWPERAAEWMAARGLLKR